MRISFFNLLPFFVLALVSACATENVGSNPIATYECSDVVVLGRSLDVHHSDNDEPDGNLTPNTKITIKDVIWGNENRRVVYATRLSAQPSIGKDIEYIFVLIPTYHGYLVRGVYISNEINRLDATDVCPNE